MSTGVDGVRRVRRSGRHLNIPETTGDIGVESLNVRNESYKMRRRKAGREDSGEWETERVEGEETGGGEGRRGEGRGREKKDRTLNKPRQMPRKRALPSNDLEGTATSSTASYGPAVGLSMWLGQTRTPFVRLIRIVDFGPCFISQDESRT